MSEYGDCLNPLGWTSTRRRPIPPAVGPASSGSPAAGPEPNEGGLAITGRDDHAVIAEVDRGESYLDSKWQAALEDGELSPETRDLIGACYESVRSGRQRWEQLNHSLSDAR